MADWWLNPKSPAMTFCDLFPVLPGFLHQHKPLWLLERLGKLAKVTYLLAEISNSFQSTLMVQVRLYHNWVLFLHDPSLWARSPSLTPQGCLTLWLFQSFKIIFSFISETIFISLILHVKTECSDNHSKHSVKKETASTCELLPLENTYEFVFPSKAKSTSSSILPPYTYTEDNTQVSEGYWLCSELIINNLIVFISVLLFYAAVFDIYNSSLQSKVLSPSLRWNIVAKREQGHHTDSHVWYSSNFFLNERIKQQW